VAWNRARLWVYGPRDHAVPVLTSSALGDVRAEAETPNYAAPFDFTGLTVLDFDVDGTGAISCLVSGGTFVDIAAVTVPEAETWLVGCIGAGSGTIQTSGGSSPNLAIVSDIRGVGSSVEILPSGDVAAAMQLVPGLYGPVYSGSDVYNDIRVRTDPVDEDPRVARTTTDFTYTLADVAGLPPGTYLVRLEARITTSSTYGYGMAMFQIGTDVEETKTATNCVDCHEDERMHGRRPMDADVCLACHDYDANGDPAGGWASSGDYGFLRPPLSRVTHGVHFAHYVDDPDGLHVDGLEHVIFPVDVRNCTKCHSENDKYASKPARVPCSGCHDSDADWAHMTLMTVDLTPADPFNGDELESCDVCHGMGSGLAVEVVHNVWDPYEPPYPREP